MDWFVLGQNSWYGNNTGSVSVPEWGTGPFLVPGTLNQRINCTVDGIAETAIYNGNNWTLAEPSVLSQAYVAANEMPPASSGGLLTTQYRLYQSGGMYLQTTSHPTVYSYQNRITNIDTETLSEIAFEFCSLSSAAGAAPILGMAISIGGSGSSPGGGGWIRVTFGGNNALTWTVDGSLENPSLVTSDPVFIPGGLAPGASILVRVTVGTGMWTYATKAIAIEVNWPSNNQRSLGDYASNDTVLATNPTWSGSTYNPTWYAMLGKRTTPTAHILIHGDSLTCQTRPTAATNSTSGYGWIRRINELANGSYHVSSCGHGGTTIANALARNPEILAKHSSRITHLLIQTWSGNSSPANITGTTSVKNDIMAMETQAIAAGLKFLVITLKPHGSTISGQDEIDAYWHLVDWATTRYGVRHINLSTKINLTSDGGPTLLNSEDGVHFNNEGQNQQAISAKPEFDAALLADGYSV